MTKNNIINTQQREITGFENLQDIDSTEFFQRPENAVGTHIQKNFINQRIKDGKYNKCHFEECHFNVSGFSGSQFMDCKLENCHIENSNFQYCGFMYGTRIYGDKVTEISNSNLSQSSFINASIYNANFKSTTFSQALLTDLHLQNIIFDSCTLQDNIFQNVVMDNVSLIGCNLEYSDFFNVEFRNSSLPFHQIIYTYGLLEAIAKQSEEVIVGAKSSGKNIKGQEFLALLPELLKYYKEINDFFPVINILIYMGDFKKAEEIVSIAIKNYIIYNNFRKVKGICRLVANHMYFDKHFMAELYFKIIEYYNHTGLSKYEQHQYSLHINEIEQILTGTQRNLPSAQVVLKTNFSSTRIDHVGEFHNVLETCLSENGISTDDFTIEIRHNSEPLSFWVTIVNMNWKLIVQAVGELLTIVSGNPSYLLTAVDILANVATIGSFMDQIAQNRNNQSINSKKNIADFPERIKKKRKLLTEKSIEVSIKSTYFNFNYKKKVESVR